MSNETSNGRDGWIMAMGRKFYQVYKQNFPMEFWYGLTPEDNREDSRRLIDVRSLPEKYQIRPLERDWSKITRRSFAKQLREQENAHALTFANAIYDGYDFDAHIEREEQRYIAEAEVRARNRKQEQLRRAETGLCPDCESTIAPLLICDCEVPF